MRPVLIYLTVKPNKKLSRPSPLRWPTAIGNTVISVTSKIMIVRRTKIPFLSLHFKVTSGDMNWYKDKITGLLWEFQQ